MHAAQSHIARRVQLPSVHATSRSGRSWPHPRVRPRPASTPPDRRRPAPAERPLAAPDTRVPRNAIPSRRARPTRLRPCTVRRVRLRREDGSRESWPARRGAPVRGRKLGAFLPAASEHRRAPYVAARAPSLRDGYPDQDRWASTFTTVPLGSSTKKRRTPHDSLVSGYTTRNPRRTTSACAASTASGSPTSIPNRGGGFSIPRGGMRI
jgi:hypothetical protein